MVLFAVKNLLSLIRSHLFILFLFPLVWEINLKKKIAAIYIQEYFAYVFL